MPARIQRQRIKGWRMPAGAVYVGRPGRWANPFIVVRDGQFMGEQLFRVVPGPTTAKPFAFYGGQRTRAEAAHQAVRLYRRWITGSAVRITDLVPELGGKDLACWCPLDQPCHADVLLDLANSGVSL